MADGRSTVSVDAELRDGNGKFVPDGTRVIFSTDLGTFRDSVVLTRSGIAHTVLVAGSIAGIAKITATAITYQATATSDFQFVGDRSLLSSAKEYIEVVGEKEARYSYDSKIVAASGSKRRAFLRYREIEIRADDLQVNVSTYEVRAKNAVLKVGRVSNEFAELYFKLNERHGFGLTTYKRSGIAVQPDGRAMRFVPGADDQESFGQAEISAGALSEPKTHVPADLYDFDDLGESKQEVGAKKVIAFPNKQLQFERADIYVNHVKVLKLPLYEMDMNGQGRLFSDQILNVNDNQLAINYPYFITLKPGESSLLRFRTGQTDGRGLVANRGLFMDYEYNWNKGDDMQGNLTLEGLGRSDWGIRANQYYRFDQSSNVAATLEVPSHRSLFGTLNAMKQFKGYELNVDASAGRAFSGTPYSTQQYSLSLERDPIKLGHLPLQFYLGAQAFSRSTQTFGFAPDPNDPAALPISQKFTESQTAYGLQLRAQGQQISFGPNTTFSTSFSVSKLDGHNTLSGFTYLGSAALSHRLGPNGNLVLSYDYVEDGFNSALLGRHQVSLQASYNKGNAYLSFFGLKGLDADRFAYQADASYRLNRSWRLGYSLTTERYFGDSYADYSLVLGYRIGYKEVGLTWSQRTKRFGFQVLGTTFN